MGSEVVTPLFVLIVLLALSALVGGVVMMLAARMAGVTRAGYARSVVAAGLSAIMYTMGSVGCGVVPVAGSIGGFLLGVALAAVVVMGIFKTTFGRALLVLLCTIVVQVGLTFVLAMLLGVGTGAMLSF
ncbi:MAG TPA: hypothetical protein VMZ31_05950 [Phycisphaerae bacterium]|nr:hypothetical protein [Phycisphaerae bacterium]